MPKTHTKINQLAGETLKGFAYANTTDKELVDDILATRDETNGYTEIAREYDSIAPSISYTGVGNNNLVINSSNPANSYTVTVDSPLQTLRTASGGAEIDNDAVFSNASVSSSMFTVDTDSTIAYISTPETTVSGTFINGEQIFGNLGFSGFFISYNGTDFVYAYTGVPPVTGEIITGNNSGATITIGGTETSLGKETFTWSESDKSLNILGGGLLICETFPQTIGTVNTVDVQFGFTIGHQPNGEYRFFNGYGVVMCTALPTSFIGTITDGEILTGSVSGATFKVWVRNYATDFLYVIQLTGTYSAGETLIGATGSIKIDYAVLVGDSVSISDGTITENNKAIIIGPAFTDSEAIVFNGGDLDIYFSNDFPFQTPYRVVGDVWNITNAPTTITTGYETNQVQFPNFPFALDASALVGTDGTDKVAIGVFDFSPFGQDKLTAGIVSFYGDGSQSTFTESKGFANLNIFDVSTNGTFNINYSPNEFAFSGLGTTGFYQLNLDGNSFRYQTNGNTFTLPNQPGAGAGYVVTDVNGNGVFTMEEPNFPALLPSYADDADAGANGLVAGKKYQTNGTAAAPLNVAGIVMIKQ